MFRSITNQAKFWLLFLVPIVAMVTILVLAGNGNRPEEVIKVDLDNRSWVSPVQQVDSDFDGQPDNKTLRVAISAVLSPTRTLEYYQDLLDYMEQKLDRQVTMILKPTYAEINDLVRGRRADVAFVCTLAYVEGNEDFGMELLVAPRMYGRTEYYSYLIVPAESSAVSLESLRGTRFAFTDPISNSGHLAPSYQLSLLGEDPVSFFEKYIFTYSHDNSITAVADKLVDGAAVDSLVYDKLAADNSEIAAKTRVISRWGPYGIPPLVVSPELDPRLKQQLLDFFLELHTLEEGMKILDNLNIDKFVIVNDDLYASIREMKKEVGW